MKTNIFSIFDEKAQAFTSPFFQPAVGQAMRAFNDLVVDSKTTIYSHPEDFSLYHIGVFDDNDAQVESFPQPRLLARATEFSVKKSVTPVLQPN